MTQRFATPTTVAPGAIRAGLDLNGLPLVVGCRVRSFGQAIAAENGRLFGFETDGPRADYVDGVLVALDERALADARRHPCYTIAGETVVESGIARQTRETIRPPVNGTRTDAGRITVGVVRLVDPVTTALSLAGATAQMTRRIAEGIYATPETPTAADQERTTTRLRADLEACFGFVGEPGIPDAILAKAFAIAREHAFNRVGRFVPAAILEDYADLAELLSIGRGSSAPAVRR